MEKKKITRIAIAKLFALRANAINKQAFNLMCKLFQNTTKVIEKTLN